MSSASLIIKKPNYVMTSCCESEDMEVVCHRYVYERVLRSEGDHLQDQHLRPNVARWRLYQTYVRAHYGILGRGNRVFVPQCVKDVIREMFPDPGGEYMGHMPADVSD